MTDLMLVDCYLPDSPVKQGYFNGKIEGTPAAGLTISVSNDGIHKSEETLNFISYDSACMTCNITTGCLLKVSDQQPNKVFGKINTLHMSCVLTECTGSIVRI